MKKTLTHHARRLRSTDLANVRGGSGSSQTIGSAAGAAAAAVVLVGVGIGTAPADVTKETPPIGGDAGALAATLGGEQK